MIYCVAKHGKYFAEILFKHLPRTDKPSKDTPIFAVGSDAINDVYEQRLPRSSLTGLFLPGIGHIGNPITRRGNAEAMRGIAGHCNTVLVQSGHMQLVLPDATVMPHYIDLEGVQSRVRTCISSIIHAGVMGLKKERYRQKAVMERSGLPWSFFPPNGVHRYIKRDEYLEHILEADAFVHCAQYGDYGDLDGKYTASLLEAAAGGAICFWHDAFDMGNDFKSIIQVPSDPDEAAEIIKSYAQRRPKSIAYLSRKAMKEIRSKCDPKKAAEFVRKVCEGVPVG